MSAFHEEQHEDAIAVCGCLVSTAAFFLSSPLMCSSVATGACQSLLTPLHHQKKLRKLLNKGSSANLLIASGPEEEGRTGANHDEGDALSPSPIVMSASSSSSLLAASSSPLPAKTGKRGEQSIMPHGKDDEEKARRDDELVVRLFHAGFMVFLVCQRWGVGRVVSSHTREKAFGSEKSRGLCGFADCCGGVVKLDRADLLAECLEAVCCSIEPSVSGGCSVTSAATTVDSSSSLGMAFEGNYRYMYGGTAHSASSSSSSLGASVPARAAVRHFDEEDCIALKAFVAAVVERHPHTEASVSAARLLVLLGDTKLFPSCSTDDDDDDVYNDAGENNYDADNKGRFNSEEERKKKKRSPALSPSFVAAFITLVSRWDSFAVLEAVWMVADRQVRTKDWYEADVGVFLQTLRMGEGRETDATAKCLIERAIRVVIRDTLLVNRDGLGGGVTDGHTAQNERHMLALWLSRMDLSEDYFDSFVERGISVRDLAGSEKDGEGVRVTSIGRLEILDKLGVTQMDDVEKIFRVLSE